MRKVAMPMVSSDATRVPLRPMLVTEVAEDHGANGPREEGDTEDGERTQQRVDVSGVREEELREDEYRRGGIGVEVVELDRRADQAREDHLAPRVHWLSGLAFLGWCGGRHVFAAFFSRRPKPRDPTRRRIIREFNNSSRCPLTGQLSPTCGRTEKSHPVVRATLPHHGLTRR